MTAAPGLLAEAARVTQAGSGLGLDGICPNAAHTYGFHLPSSRLPASDYSLSGALNRPVGDHCCAIDVITTTPTGRAYVKHMFDLWDAKAQPPDMAEFIGSPDGRRVLYASFKKPGVVELYRGSGHDTWCHNSKYRSLATKDGGWFDPHGRYLGAALGQYHPTSTPTVSAGQAPEDDMTPQQAQQLSQLVSAVEQIGARVANVERYCNSLFTGNPAVLDAGGGRTVTIDSPLAHKQ